MSNLEKVIASNELGDHVVQKYRFKALDINEVNIDDENVVREEREERREVETDNIEVLNETTSGEEESFVEELLRKTDELSSNIIKLQMQMEKQQEEFEKRLEEEKKRAFDEGKDEGIAQTEKSLQSQSNELKEQFLNSITKLDEMQGKMENDFEQLEKELSETAIAIAEKIIKKEINEDSSNVTYSIVKSLIEKLKDATKITIKVNSKDFNYITEHFGSQKHITIEEDDAISPGGVILLSDAGNIDGTIETRTEKTTELINEE